MNLRDYDTDHQYNAIVSESTRLTDVDSEVEVRHIVLDVPDNTPRYSEGQTIGVLVEGPHEFGNEYHMRLYSIASAREGDDGRGSTLAICVRRCFYIDDVSGERYAGTASNYLCDQRPGDAITITGPYAQHFSIPRDPKCNLLMIGVGTGIAPFRGFVKHIYGEHKKWKGKVRLFYGARTGMELLYMNEAQDDFTLYYDEETFKAFRALNPRPMIDESVPIDEPLTNNADEVRALLDDPRTHVYVAGQEKLKEQLDVALARNAGSEEAWQHEKAALVADGRWSELYY